MREKARVSLHALPEGRQSIRAKGQGFDGQGAEFLKRDGLL